MRSMGPCLCGALDCSSCGPAQGVVLFTCPVCKNPRVFEEGRNSDGGIKGSCGCEFSEDDAMNYEDCDPDWDDGDHWDY